MMIRKTALARALREAFPNDFGNTYSEEESADIEATAKQEEASGQVIDPINAVRRKSSMFWNRRSLRSSRLIITSR